MANTLRFKRGLASGLPTGVAGEPLFTTDTFDLYIGTSGGNQRYQKYIASGTTLQYLRGDGSLATFPTNIITGTGVAGQVAYWSGASTQTGNAGLVFNGTNRLTIDGGTTGYLVGPTGEMLIGEDGAGLYIGGGFGVNTPVPLLYGSNGTTIHIWYANTAERMRLTSNGRLLLGSTSEGTQRLQVTGDTLLKGSGNTSATTALLVENSDGTDLLRVRNDGAILITPVGESPYFAGFTGTTQFGGAQRTMGFVWNGGINRPTPSFYFTASSTIGWASGDGNFILTGFTFNPTSGTGTLNTHIISPVINQTGGANGITRGLYVNPTLTAAADWRSIEWSNNTGWGLYGAGSANSYFGGRVGVQSTSLTDVNFRIAGTLSGSTGPLAVIADGTISSTSTVGGYFFTTARTQAAAFTLNNLQHYTANSAAFGAGSTVTNQYGFIALATLTGATNNYGFFGNIASGTGRWNLYMDGTAANFLSGNTQIGTGAFTSEKLQVNGTMKVTGASTFGASIGTIGDGDIGGLLNHRNNIRVLNKAATNWVTWATRNTAGAESLIDLSNIGTLTTAGIATINSINVAGAAGFSSTIDLTGVLFHRTGFSVLNKAGNNWISWVVRNTSGAETVINLQNIGTLDVTGAATFSSSVTAASATIGTAATTGYSLVVGNSGANDLSGIRLTNGGTDNGYFITAYNGVSKYASLQAGDNVAYRNIILNNLGGNVAIGTTTAVYKFTLAGTSFFTDNLRFPNLKGVIFEQTGGILLGSIAMDGSNQITIDNNGFFGLSVGSNYTMTGGNLGIGHNGFGTSATRTLSVLSGTAPSTSPADSFQMYSNDVVAGNAAPHFRTENGAIIKLYQETTSVGNSIISLGGGSSVLDDTTFDGYTLRQIVKALRNQGILA